MKSRPAPARLPLSLAALVLVAFALSGLMTGVLARGFAGDLTGSVTPPTATVASVRTPTLPPATATLTQQQILDQQAAAAFRAIYLTTASDGSCASSRNQTSFPSGSLVTINLCVAHDAPSGAFAAVLRQDGVVRQPVIPDQQASPNHWYSRGIRIGTPGSYDMLVTFNGGKAADLAFTVS